MTISIWDFPVPILSASAISKQGDLKQLCYDSYTNLKGTISIARRKQYDPQKCRNLYAKLHGITSCKSI